MLLDNENNENLFENPSNISKYEYCQFYLVAWWLLSFSVLKQWLLVCHKHDPCTISKTPSSLFSLSISPLTPMSLEASSTSRSVSRNSD